MSNIEHRRIAFAAGVITTPDPDWAGTHTKWTAVDDGANTLATGAIKEVNPVQGALGAHIEVFVGAADIDAPIGVTPVITVDLQIVTRHVVRGSDTFETGSISLAVSPQRRQVELEVPAQGQSAVRVTNATGLAGAGAIVIFVSESVHL